MCKFSDMTHCIVFSGDLSETYWAEFYAFGFDQGFDQGFDGSYKPDQMQEILGNNKPVYHYIYDDTKCIWHAGNHWWIGNCTSIGKINRIRLLFRPFFVQNLSKTRAEFKAGTPKLF